MEWKNVRKIYEAVAEEQSKKIFCRRFLYSVTGDISLLDEMKEDFQNASETHEGWITLKRQILDMQEKPYIFGCGTYGKGICRRLGEGVFAGFIDNTPRSDICMGLQVWRAEDFLNRYSGEKIVLPSKAYFFAMRKQLLETGVDAENIIDGTAWYDATEGRQYFDLPYLTYGENEVFVDGGSCDGTSAVRFTEQCRGKYKKIYCFEPDGRNVEKLRQNLTLRGITDYEVIEKGMWSESDSLSFTASGNEAAHIAVADEHDAVKVKVISLDEVLNGEPVSFIKMDIEGAEYKALEGARDTITRYKPKLAICVYHKTEDIWELPGLILEMRPDYRLYFRHYSDNALETVVYAL